MLSVVGGNSEAFYMIVLKDDGCAKPQLQVKSDRYLRDYSFSLVPRSPFLNLSLIRLG